MSGDSLPLRSYLKLARFAAIVSAYFARASVISLLTRDLDKRRQHLIENVHNDAVRLLRALDVKVTVAGLDRLDPKRNYLFVCNHMSYMDVIVFSSARTSIFVTSVDMGNTLGLGQLAALGGSLFVERRSRTKVASDLKMLSDALRRGFDMVIFPEGTSTNGLKLLPFKKPLLRAAIDAGVDVVPVALKYESIDGEKFGPENCDQVAWHGDMDFVPHIIELAKLRDIRARLEFLAPITVQPDSSRRALADQTQAAIERVYFTDHVARANESGPTDASAPTASTEPP